jgi:hypothetical protein
MMVQEGDNTVCWYFRAGGSKESVRSGSSSTAAATTEPTTGNKSEHPRLCCGVDCHEPPDTSASHTLLQSCHPTTYCYDHHCNTPGCCGWESLQNGSSVPLCYKLTAVPFSLLTWSPFHLMLYSSPGQDVDRSPLVDRETMLGGPLVLQARG